MNKQNREPEEKRSEPARREQQNNSRVTLRILLALYLAYLIYQMVKGYRLEGDPILGIAALFFAVVEVVIVVGSLRRWLREQQRINELWANTAEEPDEDSDEEEHL